MNWNSVQDPFVLPFPLSPSYFISLSPTACNCSTIMQKSIWKKFNHFLKECISNSSDMFSKSSITVLILQYLQYFFDYFSFTNQFSLLVHELFCSLRSVKKSCFFFYRIFQHLGKNSLLSSSRVRWEDRYHSHICPLNMKLESAVF